MDAIDQDRLNLVRKINDLTESLAASYVGSEKWQGKRFYPASDENVRRDGALGRKSLQIVIDNPGITDKEFFAKGGRQRDLKWDLDNGNVLMADAD